MTFSVLRRVLSSLSMPAVAGVSTTPGMTTLQRMLCAAPSLATARLKLITAALAAEYPAIQAVPNRPQIEAMLTMAPPPWSFIRRMAVRVPKKVPSTVVLKLACQSAVDSVSTPPQV
ncbi:hypothetical protein D3C72_2140800 [compost metagenome]